AAWGLRGRTPVREFRTTEGPQMTRIGRICADALAGCPLVVQLACRRAIAKGRTVMNTLSAAIRCICLIRGPYWRVSQTTTQPATCFSEGSPAVASKDRLR